MPLMAWRRSGQIREKRLSPRRAPGRSLLPLSPKRTQVRLKSLLNLVWLRQIHSEPTGVLRCKSAVCGLNGFLPRLARSRSTFHLNPRPLRAFAPTASFRGPLCFASTAPREIFRTAIIHSAYAFVLVHNHPSGQTSPSEAVLQLTKRVAPAAHILPIHFLDHVIVGQSMVGGRGFFSFQEAGLLQ